MLGELKDKVGELKDRVGELKDRVKELRDKVDSSRVGLLMLSFVSSETDTEGVESESEVKAVSTLIVVLKSDSGKDGVSVLKLNDTDIELSPVANEDREVVIPVKPKSKDPVVGS